jgi:hypothetical protein
MRAVRRNFDIARLVTAVAVYFIALNDLGRRAIAGVSREIGYIPNNGRGGEPWFIGFSVGLDETRFSQQLEDQGGPFIRDMSASELDAIGLLPGSVADKELEEVAEPAPAPDVVLAFMTYEGEAAERAARNGYAGYVGLKSASERARAAIAADMLLGGLPLDDIGFVVQGDREPTFEMVRRGFERLGLTVEIDRGDEVEVEEPATRPTDIIREALPSGSVRYTPVSDYARDGFARQPYDGGGAIVCEDARSAYMTSLLARLYSGAEFGVDGARLEPLNEAAKEIYRMAPTRGADDSLLFPAAGVENFDDLLAKAEVVIAHNPAAAAA